MRVLLDHNTPAPLRYALHGHQVETAYERSWARLLNGELIAAAESAGFDVLITTDRGIRHQQNWTGRKLALIVLSTNNWIRIRNCTEPILAALNSIQLGRFVEVEIA